jgi:chromosome segregation ATPase
MVIETNANSANNAIGGDGNPPAETTEIFEPDFERRVEQLTALRDQLAIHVDLLRKDGSRLLERHRQLGNDRESLLKDQQTTQEQRAALDAQRLQIEAMARDVVTRRQELDQRTSELDAATAEFNKLLEQKDRYVRQSAEAQQALDALRGRLEQADQQLVEYAKRTEEMARLAAEKDRWTAQVMEAKSTVASLLQQQQEISQRTAEFAAREKAIQDSETEALQQQTALTAALREIETQRQALHDAEAALAEQRQDLQSNAAAHQSAVEYLQRQEHEFNIKFQDTNVLKNNHDRLAEEVQTLQARVAELQSQLANSDEIGTQLREDMATAQAESQEMLRRKDQHVATLEHQVRDVSDRLAAVTAQLDQSKKQLATQADQLAVAQRQGIVFQAAKAELESQVAQMLVQQQDQMETAEVQKRLAAQKRGYEHLISAKQNQIVELERLVEMLQAQVQGGSAAPPAPVRERTI